MRRCSVAGCANNRRQAGRGSSCTSPASTARSAHSTRPGHLASQHMDLVAQQKQFGVLGCGAPPAAHGTAASGQNSSWISRRIICRASRPVTPWRTRSKAYGRHSGTHNARAWRQCRGWLTAKVRQPKPRHTRYLDTPALATAQPQVSGRASSSWCTTFTSRADVQADVGIYGGPGGAASAAVLHRDCRNPEAQRDPATEVM